MGTSAESEAMVIAQVRSREEFLTSVPWWCHGGRSAFPHLGSHFICLKTGHSFLLHKMLWTTSPGNRRNLSWHEHDLGTIWCLRWGGGGRDVSPSELYYTAKAPEKSHSLLFAQCFPKPRAPGFPAFPRCLEQLSGFNSNLEGTVFAIRSIGSSKFHGRWWTLQLNDLQWSQASFKLKCKTRNIARQI